jgi:ABC-type multidrug transport system fused ATPase/permease subunit
MLLALLNFLDYSGSITIDGVEVSKVPLQKLRSCITTITQDYVELHGSVRNNLLPYAANSSETITDDIVVDALKNFGLWERVSSSGGLNAEMATLGLSQGEKQLLYITRAFLHHRKTRSKVILVDEATSNMDRETDQNVQLLMKENFKGSTILMVAHRHDTIKDADMVIELANGRIVGEN